MNFTADINNEVVNPAARRSVHFKLKYIRGEIRMADGNNNSPATIFDASHAPLEILIQLRIGVCLLAARPDRKGWCAERVGFLHGRQQTLAASPQKAARA